MSPNPSDRLRRLQYGTVYCAAVVWPWGAYEQVLYGHGLFSAALAVLAVLLALSWVRHGRPGMPFDLLWPASLIIGCASVHWAAGEGIASPGIIVGCGAFLLALFGSNNQTLVYRALALASVSAGGVAVLTVLAEFNRVFPTFFSQQGGAVGVGPTSLIDALFLFAWSFFTALALFVGRRRLLWKAGAWLLPVAALCCGAAFYLLARRLQADSQTWNPNYSALAFPLLPFMLLVLYLVSRVAARVFVLAESSLLCMQSCLGGLLLLFSLVLVFVGHVPPPGLCFSFGLVAALGVQGTLRNNAPAKTGWLWALVIPVLAAHAVMLFPGDARDYVQHAQMVKKMTGSQAAKEYLGLVLRRFPGESRARLELARLELERGEVEAAADTFLGAMREHRGSCVFCPPNQEIFDDVLADIKKCSEKMPGIAYERCLVGVGSVGETVTTLKSRIKTGPDVDIDADPLRRALRCLLGFQEGEVNLGDWTAAELLAGLQRCGPYCQAVQAPEGFPRRYLPTVLTSRPIHDGRMVAVFYPDGQTGRSWRMNSCAGETPGEGDTLWLDTAQDSETGEWHASLAGSADVEFGDNVSVSLIEDATLDCAPAPNGWAVMCLLP